MLGVLLAYGLVPDVHASAVRCVETEVQPAGDIFQGQSTIWVGATGNVVSPDPDQLRPITDAAGDAVDRGGNPVDDPDAVCAAILKLLEPAGSAIDALAYVDRAKFKVVLPEEPSDDLAAAIQLVAVVVEFQRSFPVSTTGNVQFGVSFDSVLHPNYAGPALELIGRDTTLDVYLDGGVWTLGRTEYRSGSFGFTRDSNQFAAIIGDGRVTIVFPESAMPEGVGTIGFFAVSGSGVDVLDLGSFDPSALLGMARSGAVSATEPPPSGGSATALPTSTPHPDPSQAPSSAGGNLGWVLPAGLAGLLLAGGIVGGLVVRSRRRGADGPIGEVAAAVIAADVATTRRTGRPGKGG